MSGVPPSHGPRRRRWPALALVAAFVGLPVLEIWAILQVGDLIGAWWTVALLVLDSVLGAWIVRREGGRAWTALRDSLGHGVMPTRELVDGALILLGGALMLTPGFVSDALGALLVLPVTRPLVRRLLLRVAASRIIVSDARRPGPSAGGPVVRGDVVE